MIRKRKIIPVIEIKTPREVADVSQGEYEFGSFIQKSTCYVDAVAGVTIGSNSQ